MAEVGVPVTGKVSVTISGFRQVVWNGYTYYGGQTVTDVPAEVAAQWVANGWATVSGAKAVKRKRNTGQPDKSFGRGG
jgi:hypothetical protein